MVFIFPAYVPTPPAHELLHILLFPSCELCLAKLYNLAREKKKPGIRTEALHVQLGEVCSVFDNLKFGKPLHPSKFLTGWPTRSPKSPSKIIPRSPSELMSTAQHAGSKSMYKDDRYLGRGEGTVSKLNTVLISSPCDAKPWRAALTPFSKA